MLRDFQQAMMGAVLRNRDVAAAGLFGDGEIPTETGLSVYRNTVFTQLSRALGDLYPVVRQLVGDGFFGYAANAYITTQPPRSPALVEYGACFPAFLDDFTAAERVPYLGDVARFELARHQAMNSPDAPPLEPAALGGVPPDRFGALRLQPHPSTRLLHSEFPVLAIWNAHQEPANIDSLRDLEPTPTHLLVGRPKSDVEVIALDDEAADFVAHLIAGDALADAFAATSGAWNPQAILSDLLLFGAFTTFSLREETTC